MDLGRKTTAADSSTLVASLGAKYRRPVQAKKPGLLRRLVNDIREAPEYYLGLAASPIPGGSTVVKLLTKKRGTAKERKLLRVLAVMDVNRRTMPSAARAGAQPGNQLPGTTGQFRPRLARPIEAPGLRVYRLNPGLARQIIAGNRARSEGPRRTASGNLVLLGTHSAPIQRRFRARE